MTHSEGATFGDHSPLPGKGLMGSLLPRATFGLVWGPGSLILFGFISYGDCCPQGSLTSSGGKGAGARRADETQQSHSFSKIRILVKLQTDFAWGWLPDPSDQ